MEKRPPLHPSRSPFAIRTPSAGGTPSAVIDDDSTLRPNRSPFAIRTPSAGRTPSAVIDEDSIAPIPNNTNSGGQRVTTPTTRSGGTPVNIRPDSNGRGNRRGTSAPKQRILAQAIHESQYTSRIHTNIRSSSTNRPRSPTKNRNRRYIHSLAPSPRSYIYLS